MKTVPGGKKNGAKSILGSNPFRKVVGEIFHFSACTLVSILHVCISYPDVDRKFVVVMAHSRRGFLPYIISIIRD